jgi:hypothetical protein
MREGERSYAVGVRNKSYKDDFALVSWFLHEQKDPNVLLKNYGMLVKNRDEKDLRKNIKIGTVPPADG